MAASDGIQAAARVCFGLYLDGRRVPERKLSTPPTDSVGKVLHANMTEKGYLKEALNLIFCLVAHQVTPMQRKGRRCM